MRFDEDGQAAASFECAATVGEKLYFSEILGNEIFCYDIQTAEMTLLCTVREENEEEKRLFSCMIVYETYLFLFPFFANAIYKIDLRTGIYDVLELPNDGMTDYKGTAKFIDAHLCKDIIYVMPAAFPGILEIQCRTNEIIVHKEWIQKIPLEMLHTDAAFFRKSLCINDQIYAPSCNGNIVMIFDLKNTECTVKRVGSSHCRFSGICREHDNFWLSPRDNGPIVKWNETDDVWQEYTDFPEEYVAASTAGIELWGNQIFVFPQMANMILTIDCSTGRIREWDKQYRDNNVIWYKQMENILILCLAQTAEVVVITENSVKVLKLFFPPKIQERYSIKKSSTYRKLKNGMAPGDMIYENYVGALEQYLNYIATTDF